MNAPSRRGRAKSLWVAPIAIVLIGLLLSVIVSLQLHQAEKKRVIEEFIRRSQSRHALITQSLNGYQECLYTLRILFDGSGDVSAHEFATASRDILGRHVGIEAIEWAPLVPHSARAGFEAELSTRIPGRTITDYDPVTVFAPAPARPSYLPILYTEPFADNHSVIGYDLSSGGTSDVLRVAAQNGQLIMRNKIELFKDLDKNIPHYGVIISCPVYDPDSQGLHTADPARLRGFIQIVFRINSMLEQTWKDHPFSILDVLVEDTSTHLPLDDPFLYARLGVETGNPLRTPADFGTRPIRRFNLTIGTREWRFSYAPTTGWLDAQTSSSPWFVFTGGILSSLLLAGLIRSSARRSELVEQQVNERTAELRHTQNLLEADILKRQAAEAELRESRRQLDNLLRQMPGMAYRFDNHTPPRATFISRGSIEIIGHTPQDLVGGAVNYSDLILPDDLPAHRQAVSSALDRQTSYESEYRLRDKTGAIKWVLDRGQGIYTAEGRLLFIEGLAIDITRRKQAEAEKVALDRKLLESQKLESLGVLAGGIAHDFNNLLTTIVGHAGILRLDLPRHSSLQSHLEQIENGTQRAAELCQQMLAYAGKGRFLIQRTSLEALVRDTTPLLEHSISKRASLAFNFTPGVPEVDVDATQIRQIIMNLVVNASDALGDRDGSITVETVSLRRDDPQLARAVIPPPPGEGDFACLRVTDTGSGMNADTLARIFDPFFSTKFAGRGLGLAAVLGIVRSHQGSLLVASTPGAGSTFTLLLPGASTPAPERSNLPARETRVHPLAGTVLLIDDEDGVRDVAEQMFGAFGLKTLTAANGVEGLELFQLHQDKIALVLLDLTMPRMNGEETLRHLRVLAPQLPVILMSGYNESAVPQLATDPRVSFLQKPFSLAALRKQISQMLS
jgi:PAS domain S-box-containing protein